MTAIGHIRPPSADPTNDFRIALAWIRIQGIDSAKAAHVRRLSERTYVSRHKRNQWSPRGICGSKTATTNANAFSNIKIAKVGCHVRMQRICEQKCLSIVLFVPNCAGLENLRCPAKLRTFIKIRIFTAHALQIQCKLRRSPLSLCGSKMCEWRRFN